MNLRDDIIGKCPTCGGSGVLSDVLCNCSIKFRVYNRLLNGGFNKKTLDLVSSPAYNISLIESGNEYLQYYLYNPFVVMERGLGLFLFSKENGRGKTTLAHYLAYVLVWPFCKTENYSRSRTYSFIDSHSLFENKEVEDIRWQSTLLVIDDLGSENRTASWKKDNVISTLHQILHFRRNNKLPTIFTSNYTPSSLSSFYERLLDSLLEIKADGTIGGQLLRQVEIGGAEDFRIMSENTEWPT